MLVGVVSVGGKFNESRGESMTLRLLHRVNGCQIVSKLRVEFLIYLLIVSC